MNQDQKDSLIITRRDTLRVCLLPATAAAVRFLGACSSGTETKGGGATGGQAGSLGAPLTGGATGSGGAANGGASAITGGTMNAPNPGTGGVVASPATGGGAGVPPGTGGATGSGGAASGGMAGAANTGGSTISADAGSVPWATGGTKSIMGGYPDPFAGTSGTMCKLYPAQTIGPCYAQSPMMRADISDGLGGLPMRLSFLLVHSSGCAPVAGATIDIWHSGSSGIYSAYATNTICNNTTQDVLMQMFCRGVQTTNADGRTDFDTVFPGWYAGRTIHVHFTVRVNGREMITSQLYFDDSLTEQILVQGDYAARGKRDTTNKTDILFLSGGATAAEVLFQTAKRPDGVLQAWKVLSIS